MTAYANPGYDDTALVLPAELRRSKNGECDERTTLQGRRHRFDDTTKVGHIHVGF